MTHKTLFPVFLVPSGIVLIPAAAMLLHAEGWAWSRSDFVICWLVIAGAMAAYKFVVGRAASSAYRLAAGIAVTTAVILLWINGAVGLIGSENNPANLLYAGVLLIGSIGAALARLQPRGMAWTLCATAAAQFLVPVVAWSVWRPDFSPGVAKVFALNSVFVLLFAASAVLFRRAGNHPPAVGAPPLA